MPNEAFPTLPAPRAELGGCVWLPRLVAKARQFQTGQLGAEYAARFCDADSVDDYFLRFFTLAKDDLLDAVGRPSDDAALAAWFRALPGVDAARITEWNALAANLGKPGFPMADRLAAVLPTSHRHLDPAQIHSIFDLLEADESRVDG